MLSSASLPSPPIQAFAYAVPPAWRAPLPTLCAANSSFHLQLKSPSPQGGPSRHSHQLLEDLFISPFVTVLRCVLSHPRPLLDCKLCEGRGCLVHWSPPTPPRNQAPTGSQSVLNERKDQWKPAGKGPQMTYGCSGSWFSHLQMWGLDEVDSNVRQLCHFVISADVPLACPLGGAVLVVLRRWRCWMKLWTKGVERGCCWWQGGGDGKPDTTDPRSSFSSRVQRTTAVGTT